jgi:deoxyribonuclease V
LVFKAVNTARRNEKLMHIKDLHDWDLSYSQARELQSSLAGRVEFKAVRKRVKLAAGIDCALSGPPGSFRGRGAKRIYAVVVVLRLPDFELLETTNAEAELTFPYIPGLLSFREAPVCIEAVKKLRNKPDVFIIDGQGIAHPRRLGIAAHLGIFFDTPTIGCAKSRLIGEYEEPPPQKGTYSPLIDQEEIIGGVLRTRDNVKPVFVSVGNKCRLEDAIGITLGCTTKYRLPEPTRLAHQQVGKLKHIS